MTIWDDYPEIDADTEDGDMFATPVPVPVPDVLAPPLKCLAVNEEYAKHVALAMERLTWHDAWAGAEADVQRGTQGFEHVISQLLDGPCLEGDCDTPATGDCIEISPFHPAIEYWPNHPIINPTYTPAPYSAPPWRTGAGLPFLTGDDAVLDQQSLLDPLIITENWNIGVPSIRIHFEGAGEVDLTFVDAVQGGNVWLFPDGNPLVGSRVDTNHIDIIDITTLDWLWDIIELLGGQPVNEVHHSVKFDTSGPHTLTLWFVPLGESFPFVGYGGGLRNIQLCGEIEVVEEQVMPYNLVLNGCDLELQLDGVPVDTVEVMTPEALCAFTDTVEIERASQSESPPVGFLRLDATDAPTFGQGAGILFANKTAAEQAAITSGWRDAPLSIGALSFWSRVAAGMRRSYMISPSTSIIHDFRGIDHPHSTLALLNGGVDQTLLLRAVSDDLERYQLTNTGLVRQYIQNPFANTHVTALQIRTEADGVTPGTAFGSNFQFLAHSSILATRAQARIAAQWANAIDATRQGEVQFRISDYAGERIAARFGANGAESLVGFHGVTPKTRFQHVATTEAGAIDEINTTLHSYGLIDNQTTVVPDSVAGADLLGDRNLPPDSVSNECAAANHLADRIELRITAAFGVLPATQAEVYDVVNTTHGNVVTELWALAGLIVANGAASATILAEIAASLEDMVVQIASDLYNQTDHALWALAYSGYGVATGLIVQAAIRSFTLPTWKEHAYIGSELGVETHDCEPCLSGGPTGGNLFAIEFDQDDGINTDWDIHQFGIEATGHFVDEKPGPGASALGLNIRWPISAPGNVDWDLVEVIVSYQTDVSRTIHLVVRTNSGGGPIDNEVVAAGSGSITLSGSLSGFLSPDTGYIEIEIDSNEGGVEVTDFLHLTFIRLEGNGNTPVTAGRQC